MASFNKHADDWHERNITDELEVRRSPSLHWSVHARGPYLWRRWSGELLIDEKQTDTKDHPEMINSRLHAAQYLIYIAEKSMQTKQEWSCIPELAEPDYKTPILDAEKNKGLGRMRLLRKTSKQRCWRQSYRK